MFVCHTCDNPKCVRPDHLFLGSNRENVDDCLAKGRWTRLSGADNGMSKLTQDDVDLIRLAYETLSVTQLDIARAWGIGKAHVSRLINGQRWAA